MVGCWFRSGTGGRYGASARVTADLAGYPAWLCQVVVEKVVLVTVVWVLGAQVCRVLLCVNGSVVARLCCWSVDC